MDELKTGRRTRLSRIIEILEAAHEAGEAISVEVVSEVLDQAEEELAAAAAGVPQGARDLSPQEYRIALMLSGLGGGLEDAIAYLEANSRFHRFRNELARIRDQLSKALWQGMLARLPRSLAVALATEATAWGYVIWSPEDKHNLVELLAQVAAGGDVGPEMTARAAEFATKLRGLKADRAREVATG